MAFTGGSHSATISAAHRQSLVGLSRRLIRDVENSQDPGQGPFRIFAAQFITEPHFAGRKSLV
jgi:hypothetical protein